MAPAWCKASLSGAGTLPSAIWKAACGELPMEIRRTMLSRKPGSCDSRRRRRPVMRRQMKKAKISAYSPSAIRPAASPACPAASSATATAPAPSMPSTRGVTPQEALPRRCCSHCTAGRVPCGGCGRAADGSMPAGAVGGCVRWPSRLRCRWRLTDCSCCLRRPRPNTHSASASSRQASAPAMSAAGARPVIARLRGWPAAASATSSAAWASGARCPARPSDRAPVRQGPPGARSGTAPAWRSCCPSCP